MVYFLSIKISFAVMSVSLDELSPLNEAIVIFIDLFKALTNSFSLLLTYFRKSKIAL